MLKSMILCSTIFFSTFSYAEDINKLFGFELGSNLDTSLESFISKDDLQSHAIYSIKFKDFNKAIINYTPTSNKIYSIFTSVETKKSCSEERDIVVGIFSKRFGPFEKVDFGLEDAYIIKQNTKTLYIYCSGFIDKRLTINLTDSSIEELAKGEQVEIESKKESENF